MQYDIFGDTPNLAARMEQTCPHNGVHMPIASFSKMRSDLGEGLASAFEALRFETHERVEIKNMGAVDTVSLAFCGNEESVERVLASAIDDDANRAVAVHIGVLAEQFRKASWGEAKKGKSSEAEGHEVSLSWDGKGKEDTIKTEGNALGKVRATGPPDVVVDVRERPQPGPG